MFLASRVNHMIREMGPLVPLPHSPKSELEFSYQWLMTYLLNHPYVMKPPEKPKRIGSESFLVGEQIDLRRVVPQKGMGTPNPFL